MKTNLQTFFIALFVMTLSIAQVFGQDVSRIDVSSLEEQFQQMYPDRKDQDNSPRLGLNYVPPAPTVGTLSGRSLTFEGFEGVTFPPTDWDTTIVAGGTTQRWSRSTTVTGFGLSNGAAKFDFFSASGGDKQYLQTPTFPATILGEILQFDAGWTAYAGAQTSLDSFVIQTSTDGINYTDLAVYVNDSNALLIPLANYLATGTKTTASLNVPDGSWITKQYALPVGTISIRFLATSGFGNSLYIDNISTYVPSLPPMSGAYTIDPLSPPSGTNFQTFTAASDALFERGVSGPVTITVSSGLYPERIRIRPITGTSSTNTVTFQPASADGVTLTVSNLTGTSSTTDFGIGLIGCRWVTINNINILDLGVSVATRVNRGITIGTTGLNGSRLNTINNCKITLGGGVGIGGVDAASIGVVGASYVQGIQSSTMDSNTINNCRIDNADRGIGFFAVLGGGTVPFPAMNGNIVTNNILGSTLSLGDNIAGGGAIGIIMQGMYGAVCTGNSIDSIKITNASNTTTGITGFAAQISSGIFANNRIKYMSSANTTSVTAATALVGFQAGAIPGGVHTYVYNNTITGMRRPWTGAATTFVGLTGLQATNFLAAGSPGSFIYTANNSVYFSAGATIDYSTAAYRVSVTGLTTYAYNNLLYNTISSVSPTAYHAAIADANTVRTFLFSNYNDLISTGTNGVVGRFGVNNAATLDLWKAGVADTNSVSGVPVFLSDVNLNPDGNSEANWVLNGNGMPLGFVPADIVGNPRSTTIQGGATDIGAYEFTVIATPPTAIIPVAGTGNYPFTMFGNNIGNINITNVGSLIDAPITQLNVNYYSGSNPPGSNPTYHNSNGYWVVTPNVGASGFAYNITLKYSQAMLGTIASETGIRVAKSDNGGALYTPYLVAGTGAGEYQLDVNNDSITVFGLTTFSIFTLTDDVAPLPVELASFTSSTNRNGVVLNWSTVSEINNAGFDIERKPVASTTWDKVGNVTGNGTTNESKNYSFTDNGLQTGSYNYRLKQIDFNGNFQYFNLSGEVIVGVPNDFQLSQNYPNPFNPTTKINYDLPVDSKVNLRVYDMLGREVASIVNEQVTAGYYTVQLNATNFASGTYFFRLVAQGTNGKEFVMTKKMQLIK